MPLVLRPAPADEGLWGFVWRMSGWRQVALCALALAASGLGVVPIELQRRLIDDAVAGGDKGQLWALGAVYLAVAVGFQALKYAMKLGQGWLGENATAHLRSQLLARWRSSPSPAGQGEAAAILGAEAAKLGGFVGSAPSSAVADATLLLGVTAYMLAVEPLAGALALGLLAPKLVIAPLMQRRLNRLVARQVSLGRAFGAALAGEDAAALIPQLHANRMALHGWKYLMKGLLNLANALAPLGLLVLGGWLVTEGETGVGVLVAFLIAQQRLAAPLRTLIGLYRRAAQARVQHRMLAQWR